MRQSKIEPAQFSVTVPTVLPVNINAAGVITTASDAQIVNNSGAPVVWIGNHSSMAAL